MNLILLLAQTTLTDGLSKIVSIMNMISMVLVFAGLVYCGYNATMGRMEVVKPGLLGAGIAALAWVITKALFAAAGGVDSGIELQGF
jgi:hypothetical protein